MSTDRSPDPSLPAMRKGFEGYAKTMWPHASLRWGTDGEPRLTYPASQPSYLGSEWSAYQHAWRASKPDAAEGLAEAVEALLIANRLVSIWADDDWRKARNHAQDALAAYRAGRGE